jgi:hypothetical protein
MSGYWGTLMFIFGVIAFKYNDTSYDVKLANSLKVQEEELVAKLNEEDSNCNETPNNNAKYPPLSIQDASMDMVSDSKKTVPPHEISRSGINNQNSAKMISNKKQFSVHEILFFEFCPCAKRKKLKHRKDDWKYYQEKLEGNIDVIAIAKKLDELERLKNLLLNPPQLRTFEYLSTHPYQLIPDSNTKAVATKESEIKQLMEANNSISACSTLASDRSNPINIRILKQYERVCTEKLYSKEAEEVNVKGSVHPTYGYETLQKFDQGIIVPFKYTDNKIIGVNTVAKDNPDKTLNYDSIVIAKPGEEEWSKHWSWVDDKREQISPVKTIIN